MISYTAEMQLRALIRENIVDLIDADPLSEEIVSVFRRLIREASLLSEGPCRGDESISEWWESVDWLDIAEYVFGLIGLAAGVAAVSVAAGATLPISVGALAAISAGAAGISVVINLRQAVVKFMSGDTGGGFYELFEALLSGANFAPIKAIQNAGGLVSIIPEIVSLVTTAIKDVYNCMTLDDDEDDEEQKEKLFAEIDRQIKVAAERAKVTQGSTKTVIVKIEDDIKQFLCDIIEREFGEITKDQLRERMRTSGLLPAESAAPSIIYDPVLFDKIYVEYQVMREKVLRGEAVCNLPSRAPPTNGSGSRSPSSRSRSRGKSTDTELAGVARALKKTGSLEGMYKFAPGDGTIIFIDDDLDDGVRHNPVMLQKSARDMKRGEKIEGSALTFYSMSYDDRGRVATVKFRSPNGTILDVPPTSRYKPPAPEPEPPEEDAR